MKIVLLASGTVNSSLTARLVCIGRELVRHGHEVYMIAPSADKYNGFKRETFAELEGIKIIRPFQFATRFRVLNLIPYIPGALIELLRLRPEIVQIYKPTPLTIIGLVAGRSKKTKIVLDMDDLGAAVMERESGAKNWMVKVTDWCEKTAARRADAIIAASTFLENKFKQEFPEKPVVLVPNGIQSIPPLKQREKTHIIFLGALNCREILEPLFRALPEIARAYPKAPVLASIIP